MSELKKVKIKLSALLYIHMLNDKPHDLNDWLCLSRIDSIWPIYEASAENC